MKSNNFSETKLFITNEELEQFLCNIKLRDDLLRIIITKGIDNFEKLADIDKYNLNTYVNENSKKLIKENFKKICEIQQENENQNLLTIIRNTFNELGGVALSKEMLMNSFKMKGKSNSYLPNYLKESNINPSQIFSAFLSEKNISFLNYYEGFKNLKYLYLGSNKIQKVEALNFPNLLVLDLSNNFIRKIENIENLSNLTTLNLEKNLIPTLENISNLGFLDTLNLSKQGLTTNQIFEINLENFPIDNSLTSLYLDGNNLVDPSSLIILRNIRKLKLNDNKIVDIALLLDCLKEMSLLEDLSVGSNPFIETLRNFRDMIILRCPCIREIDNKTVTNNEAQYVNKLYSMKFGIKTKKEDVAEQMSEMKLDIIKYEKKKSR
jgi:Leucine-rich repeat (LRR) protein